MAIIIGTPPVKISAISPPNTPNFILAGKVFTHIPEAITLRKYAPETIRNYHGADTVLVKTKSATVTAKYSDIFYNRILLDPIKIALGNLVTKKTIKIKIFNAYFEPKTLLTISTIESEGLGLVGPTLPVTISPLGTIEFVLTATISGPPVISSDFYFTFATPEDNTSFGVTGSRIVMFPYQYKPGMIESFSWLTNILKSRNGTEQAIRIRASARQSFKINAYTTSQEFIKIKNLIYGWRTRGFAFPFFFEEKKLTNSIVSKSKRLEFDTKNASFEINGLGIVYKNQREFDVFEILEITDTYVDIKEAIGHDYDLGISVYPVKISRIVGQPIRSTSGWNATTAINFATNANTNRIKSVAMTNQYKGLDVLVDDSLKVYKPDEILPVTFSQRVDEVDFDSGNVEFFGVAKYMELTKTIRFIIEGSTEIWEFKKWLNRRAGKFLPFWLPTFESDFNILSTGQIQTSIIAMNDEYQTQGTLRKNIAIKFYDGTYIFTEIVGSSLNEFDQSVISFGTPIGKDRSEIESISYMGINRFDTDEIDLIWLQGNKIICDILVREISPQ